MPSKDEEPRSEREQTDESLRVERDKADQAILEELAAFDEVADAVISRARVRADEVLAAARAKTDRSPAPSASLLNIVRNTEKERWLEDQVLREERANADELLRLERAEHADLLSVDREETDKDLFIERVRADDLLATLDEVLETVSHDLRKMLNAMVGFAALIAKSVSRENHVDEVLVYTDRIQRSGAKMNRLIGDLIDVASIEAGIFAVTREVGDPTQVVTEAVDAFQAQASASGLSLVAEIVPPSSPAAFDPARLLQVLGNLLSNAIRFTPRNGKIVVQVAPLVDEIRFAVIDTGIGVPADKLTAVFERFRQVKQHDQRGVGLGLYISKAIVQEHGGRIWAESTVGEGSTFCFTLPLHPAPLSGPRAVRRDR